jgi:hypothetical protein
MTERQLSHLGSFDGGLPGLCERVLVCVQFHRRPIPEWMFGQLVETNGMTLWRLTDVGTVLEPTEDLVLRWLPSPELPGALQADTRSTDELTRLAFVFAEHWQRSLAEANANDQEQYRHEIELAEAFHVHRMNHWGATALETALSHAKPVTLAELRTRYNTEEDPQ